MKYEARTTAPEVGNKYYTHYNNGGLSICKVIDKNTGFTLPNCVGYAHGRLLEASLDDTIRWDVPACNAEDWYNQAIKNNLKVGSIPKLGSVIVWKSGKTNCSSDGCGHVAVVDNIDNDGNLTISESGYNSYLFKTELVKPPYNRAGMDLLGFVYPLVEFEEPKTVSETTLKKYKVQVGAYTSLANAKYQKEALHTKGFGCVCYYDGQFYRLISGSYNKKENATKRAQRLSKAGISTCIRSDMPGELTTI